MLSAEGCIFYIIYELRRSRPSQQAVFSPPCGKISAPLRDLIDQVLGILPSQTGVCDGLSITMFPDFLTAGFNVAFNHDAFDHFLNLKGVAAAVENLFYNTNLLFIPFA